MDILDIALSSLTFLSLKEKRLLRKSLSDADELASLSADGISERVGRAVRAYGWDGRAAAGLARKGALIMERQGIGCVLFEEAEYPALLREILDPPYALYFRGSLAPLLKPCVSIVGTRRPCRESAGGTVDFARDAAADGVAVVSGFANGIDTLAHRGALAATQGGERSVTVAVLPCGIDTIVPVGNKKIAEYILKTDGCLLSEYIPGTPAEPWRFVQRNRIIAALSPATLVMQAPAGSGALITADFALDFNREVIFHADGLCAAARAQDDAARKRLAAGASGSGRLRRDSRRYLEDGAPVVRSYAEYVQVRRDAPGAHIQGQLF